MVDCTSFMSQAQPAHQKAGPVVLDYMCSMQEQYIALKQACSGLLYSAADSDTTEANGATMVDDDPDDDAPHREAAAQEDPQEGS